MAFAAPFDPPADLDAPAAQADPPPADLDGGDTSRILVRWLVGLRWAVFLLLGATLPIGERYLDFHVKYAIALPVMAFVVAYNAAMQRRVAAGRVTPREVALGVAIDLVAIGALLAASGGAANPLSAVFFVHVALAASLLPARTTFALAALAACLFAALFALPSGACCPNHPANGAFSTHLYGMWGAFVIASGLVAYFLTRVRSALDERGQEIARLRRRAEEVNRFAALGTLAAGTAHELATPLCTIAVLAGEIDGAPAPEARAHAASIAAQVSRCRDILTRMQAGVATRRAARTVAADAVEAAVETWRRAHPGAAVVLTTDLAAGATVPLSAGEIEVALGAILDNALHAVQHEHGAVAIEEAPGAAPIAVAAAVEQGAVVVRVEDGGTGVAPHLASRLGEPFLTTKEPGEGMGLGLYLVRTLLTRVGGGLEVAPGSPRGTRVTLRFAAEAG
jgi:two-component system sensor histidine kinase RegB